MCAYVHLCMCIYVCMCACGLHVCAYVCVCVPWKSFQASSSSGFSLMGISAKRIYLTTLFVLALISSTNNRRTNNRIPGPPGAFEWTNNVLLCLIMWTQIAAVTKYIFIFIFSTISDHCGKREWLWERLRIYWDKLTRYT